MYKVNSTNLSGYPFNKINRAKLRSLSACLLGVTGFAFAVGVFGESLPNNDQISAEASSTDTLLIPGELAAIERLPQPLGKQDFIDGDSNNGSLFELGRHLFFDPVLSGNRNISCGTCHDPSLGTGDAVALSIGEGGTGSGSKRVTRDGITGRVPRNAQPLYNIGARQYHSFFHDGRLHANSTHVHGTGFANVDSERFPDGLDSLLASQALFPVTSAVEMAGESGENPVATAVANYQLAGENGAWDQLAQRLRQLPAYASYFQRAFDDVDDPSDIMYTHVANALAFFQSKAFRSINSRFDELLITRDTISWTMQERQGLALFYGKAGCAQCHDGALLSDHEFHAIAMPQIGPGKGHGTDASYLRSSGFADRLEDEGRYKATLDTKDLFRFRTPSLRNVSLTGPWGHTGAYDSLAAVIRHHLNPVDSLESYNIGDVERLLPTLGKVLDSTGRGPARKYHPVEPERRADYDRRRAYVQASEVLRGRIASHNELQPVQLLDSEVDALQAFLLTMTDPAAVDQSNLIPGELPSGLIPQPSATQSKKINRV